MPATTMVRDRVARVPKLCASVDSPAGVTVDEIGELYDRCASEHLRLAAAILGDVERARDVVQEAFANAIRNRDRFRGDSSLEGWVWSIVANVARDHRRRTARCLVSSELAEGASQTTLPNEDARTAELRLGISQLPARQRLVIFLRYYADLDYAQISSVLNISTGTVGATLHAAHRALRGTAFA